MFIFNIFDIIFIRVKTSFSSIWTKKDRKTIPYHDPKPGF